MSIIFVSYTSAGTPLLAGKITYDESVPGPQSHMPMG